MLSWRGHTKIQLLELHRTISELRIFQTEDLERVTSVSHYAYLSIFLQNILFLKLKKSLDFMEFEFMWSSDLPSGNMCFYPNTLCDNSKTRRLLF